MYSYCGDHVHKVGRTTGNTWGAVIETCSEFYADGTLYFCQNRVDAESGPGDSGSAVWSYASVNHQTAQFRGLLWGGDTNGDSSLFTPTNMIHNWLGSFDYGEENEAPQVAITSPAHASEVGEGSLVDVTFTASFFDFEDGIECTGCEIVRTSNVDGYLGTTSVVNGQAGPPTRTTSRACRTSVLTSCPGTPADSAPPPRGVDESQAGAIAVPGPRLGMRIVFSVLISLPSRTRRRSSPSKGLWK
ncbi:MAG: hypothetical protein VCE43_05060 [Myxococcota bacterium]